MKVAIESNDGINIASPFNLLKNFMIFEVDENKNSKNLSTSKVAIKNENQINLVGSVGETKNMFRELEDCSTIISHGFCSAILKKLNKSGIEVYVTFQNSIDKALNQYLKDKRVHEFH